MEIKLPPLPKGVVVFTFEGGPRDGETVTIDKPFTGGAGLSEGESLWWSTKGGKVGARWWQVSSGYWDKFQRKAIIEENEDGSLTVEGMPPAQTHYYEVVTSEPMGDDLYIVIRYTGTEDSKQPAS
jgi:hypothetical protein